MTTTSTMRIQLRSGVGKGYSRALRRQGMIPGILYGGGKDNVNLAVDPRDVLKGLHHRGFYTHVFEFDLNGRKERALCKAVQLHPVTDQPLHIDFMRVSKDAKIHVGVPIQFIHEADCPGIKHGGVLNIVVHSLEVICTADNIPDHLTVDLQGLGIGDTIHLDALHFPEGVVPAHPERDQTIATIVPPTVKKDTDEQSGVESTTT